MSSEPAKPTRLPTVYLPHGGGPCFFMEWTMGPPDTWQPLRSWLESFGQRFDSVSALLVVSAHWEEPVPTVLSAAEPPLLYDYYGFPAHTYELSWPASGAPEVGRRALELLSAAGISGRENSARGFDHGVFVPLKVAFPEAHIPTCQLSLEEGLNPAQHLAIGAALAPLRDEGVLIVGSGMSFHNMQAFMRPGSLERSKRFDAWLDATCTNASSRDALLAGWTRGVEATFCHPREEHLLPLMVAAGAATGEPGRASFRGEVMGVEVSAFEFGA